MLVLTLRQEGDRLVLDTPAGPIKIEVLRVWNGKARLGLACPRSVTVQREVKNGTT